MTNKSKFTKKDISKMHEVAKQQFLNDVKSHEIETGVGINVKLGIKAGESTSSG